MVYKNDSMLYYTHPAEDTIKHCSWMHALPVGNGRMGAMIYGLTETERLQINESTIWTGKPVDYTNYLGAEHVDEIYNLLRENDQKNAEAAAEKYLMGTPCSQACYQPFVDVWFHFGHSFHDVKNYHRGLDTENGLVWTEYQYNEITYRRETIASYPDQVIASNITSSKEKKIDI